MVAASLSAGKMTSRRAPRTRRGSVMTAAAEARSSMSTGEPNAVMGVGEVPEGRKTGAFDAPDSAALGRPGVLHDPVDAERAGSWNLRKLVAREAERADLFVDRGGVAVMVVPAESGQAPTESVQRVFGRQADEQATAGLEPGLELRERRR